MAEKQKAVCCAICTRKATDEGLEQEFNSLDAQREVPEAFVASQKHEGWSLLPHRYDDGGYSGGSIERPALKRLLGDVEAGKIDCIVVYKVDRLSRSLLDFARLIEAALSSHGRSPLCGSLVRTVAAAIGLGECVAPVRSHSDTMRLEELSNAD